MQIAVCAATLTKLYVDITSVPIANSSTYTGIEDNISSTTLYGLNINSATDVIRLITLPANGTLWRDAAMTLPVAINTSYSLTAEDELILYFNPTTDWFGSTSFDFYILAAGEIITNTATIYITISQI